MLKSLMAALDPPQFPRNALDPNSVASQSSIVIYIHLHASEDLNDDGK